MRRYPLLIAISISFAVAIADDTKPAPKKTETHELLKAPAPPDGDDLIIISMGRLANIADQAYVCGGLDVLRDLAKATNEVERVKRLEDSLKRNACDAVEELRKGKTKEEKQQ